MNSNVPEHIDQQIDALLQGKLNNEEKQDLLRLAEQNSDIAQAIKYKMNISRASKIYGAKQLKEHLARLFKDQEAMDIKQKPNIYPIIIILLVAALLMAVIFLVMNKEPKTPQTLYAQYYTSYEWAYGQRSTNVETTLYDISDAYRSKNYERAYSLIASLPDSLVTEELRLVKAISAYETGSSSVALASLNGIFADVRSPYRDHARWYAALIHLENDNVTIAQDLLKPLISDPRADHHEEAIALMDDIKSLR